MKKHLLFSLFLYLAIQGGVIAQCDPPPGDDCLSAPVLCTNLDGYCGSASGNLNYPGAPEVPGCPSPPNPNLLHNDEWVAFVAGTTSITLQFSWSNCDPSAGGNFCGMMFNLYEGSCGGPPVPPFSCGFYGYSPIIITYPNLTIGETYYLLINAHLPTINFDFQIDVLQGFNQYDIPEIGTIQGPNQICGIVSTSEYNIPNSLQAGLEWSLSPSGIGVFAGDPTGESVQIVWNNPGTVQLCATPTSPCYNYPPPPCIDITVNYSPTMADPPNITVCGGEPVGVQFTGTYNPTYNWVNSNPAIGLPAAGSGDIAFTAANVTTTQTANITVTPEINGCTGPPQAFTITVHPTPPLAQPANQVVCAGATVSGSFSSSPGTVFSWTNDNTAIGLGASGTGNFSFSAAQVTSQETATITVTPQLGICPGTTRTFTIIVNPIPVVDDPPDLTVCSGEAVSVAFSGTSGAAFNWTNSLPPIGLPASGTGDLDFYAVGNILTQTATITITPAFSGNGLTCTGPTQTFTITVVPVPVVYPPPNVNKCGGEPVAINFAGTPGVAFEWTNSNTAIGLDASGAGNIAFTTADVDVTQTSVVTVTPVNNGCVGQPQSFVITIANCCPTNAGTLDTTSVIVCGTKTVGVNHLGNHTLEPGDTLRFILYSAPSNPLSSILQYADSLFFPFLPGVMHLDSTYYAAVIAGNQLPNDSIDSADPCFSLVTGPKLMWRSKPTITVGSPPESVCREGCADVLFTFTGAPPFGFTWLIEQDGQVLLSKTETSDTFQKVVTVCPGDFDVSGTDGPMDFQVNFLMDKFCGCGD